MLILIIQFLLVIYLVASVQRGFRDVIALLESVDRRLASAGANTDETR